MLDYRELISSQLPALHLLTGIGWQYVTPDQANTFRSNRRDAIILDLVLSDWLRANNSIQYKGRIGDFSQPNIAEALRRLKERGPTPGLSPARLVQHHLLTL